jgi:hypothetical protein
MADATGTVTTNYGFKTLKGTDTAGYTSINALVQSVDTQLESHFSGMILVYPSATAPTGWQAYTPPVGTGSMPELPSNHIWIQKT